MKHARNPDDVHPPMAAYAHQIELSSDERLLVLSGQVGARPDGSLPEDGLDQLDVALENIDRNLRAAGMDVGDLVKLTFYLVGPMDTAGRRDVLARHLDGHTPCMTLLYVAALATPELLVEIDAWASRGLTGADPRVTEREHPQLGGTDGVDRPSPPPGQRSGP